MTGPVFVDANVLLYAYDRSEPSKLPRAMAWLAHLWGERLGRISIQVISEFYVNLRRKPRPSYSPEEAWHLVSRYFEWRPCPLDEKLARQAREIEGRYRLSWWDSMVVAAAQLQSCEVLLTEDLHDGAAFGSLVVRSPYTLKFEQPVLAYEVRPALASLHRPRGRPRRPTYA